MDPGQTSGKRGDEMSEKESAAGPGEEAGAEAIQSEQIVEAGAEGVLDEQLNYSRPSIMFFNTSIKEKTAKRQRLVVFDAKTQRGQWF
jgi:hypothetical protein